MVNVVCEQRLNKAIFEIYGQYVYKIKPENILNLFYMKRYNLFWKIMRKSTFSWFCLIFGDRFFSNFWNSNFYKHKRDPTHTLYFFPLCNVFWRSPTTITPNLTLLTRSAPNFITDKVTSISKCNCSIAHLTENEVKS